MAFLKNRWVLISLLFACWALIGSFLAAYYWIQYTDIRDRVGGVLIEATIGIDYGNGSKTWLNHTKALTGETLFDVTKRVANVTYQTGIYGTEVLSINGVAKQGNFGWTYWVWNGTGSSWSVVWESADKYVVSEGEIFGWFYQSDFLPPPWSP